MKPLFLLFMLFLASSKKEKNQWFTSLKFNQGIFTWVTSQCFRTFFYKRPDFIFHTLCAIVSLSKLKVGWQSSSCNTTPA
jgi:hypothetical protein